MPGKREFERSGDVFPPPPPTSTYLPMAMRVRIGTQRGLGVDTTMVAAHAAVMGGRQQPQQEVAEKFPGINAW